MGTDSVVPTCVNTACRTQVGGDLGNMNDVVGEDGPPGTVPSSEVRRGPGEAISRAVGPPDQPRCGYEIAVTASALYIKRIQ